MENGGRMAAVELQLAPGWKTYWRSPGDAGIPPTFDWSGSENVKSVHIHWPAPEVFEANGMQTIGYHERLVLPVEVTPEDPARPVRLSVEMSLGVCDEICMPAIVDLTADLSAPGAPDAAIQAALERAGDRGRRCRGQRGLLSGRPDCRRPAADGPGPAARSRPARSRRLRDRGSRPSGSPKPSRSAKAAN